MKLIRNTEAGREYFLSPIERDLLATVLDKYPFTPPRPGRVSRSTRDRAAHEREKLLNESLAEHRRDLARTARALLAPDKLQPGEKGHRLILTPGDREYLLQILNDIRVGCWQSLGQPDELDAQPPEMSPQEFAWRYLMHVAGDFEHTLVMEE